MQGMDVWCSYVFDFRWRLRTVIRLFLEPCRHRHAWQHGHVTCAQDNTHAPTHTTKQTLHICVRTHNAHPELHTSTTPSNTIAQYTTVSTRTKSDNTPPHTTRGASEASPHHATTKYHTRLTAGLEKSGAVAHRGPLPSGRGRSSRQRDPRSAPTPPRQHGHSLLQRFTNGRRRT